MDEIIMDGLRMPEVSVTFTNITKVNYIMQIADFLKVNIKIAKRLNSIRGTRRFTKPSQTNGYLVI